MRLLLDTQFVIWLASERERLTGRELAALEAADDVLVSALSLFELRVKRRAERRRGQSPSVLSPAEAIAFCRAGRISVHDLAASVFATTLAIDPPHGDPFDELMLVHAQALGARLLTRDDNLREHPLAYKP